MAGLNEGQDTGMIPTPDAGHETKLSSRRHFTTIAWLRWRIFVNGMRGKGAAGELVVKFLSYPFLVLMILGPAVGAGIGSYYLVDKGNVDYLAIPFWIIFVLWQFIGVNTSATGPSFDLSSLVRFPIRYRDYLLIRLSFGLMDPPTLAGIACLIASSIGIAIAAPALFPWAALTVAAYAVCNILFSRMVYSWLERWLAQRRTRELVTGVILALSLGAQFAAQYAQRLSHPRHHAPPNPLLVKAFHWAVTVNWFLPPGLAAKSIDQVYSGSVIIGVAALGGVLLYALCFLFILHRRLLAEFRGEDLSEAPAARPKTAKLKIQPGAAVPATTPSFAFLPATVAAGLVKEIRYLLRSGPKLYVLVMPVFVVFLFSARTSGMNYAGVQHNSLTGFLFCYGCAYTQLIFVGLIYNSLGSDGAGAQFYFIAPVKMRDIMLAKNLLTIGIFAIEAIFIYIAAAVIAKPAPLDLTVATLAWSAFALLLNMSIGNVRSIVSPKVLDPGKMRSQNVSGVNSLVSLVVIVAAVALGALMVALCRYFHTTYWIAAGIFLVLALLAFVAYALVLQKIDDIARNNLENLTTVLAKI
jgi:ABC-2 type transport system permease protein